MFDGYSARDFDVMTTVAPKDDGMVTLILDILLLVICWPTVVVRFLIRSKNSALGLDDWLMGLGMVRLFTPRFRYVDK